VALIPFVESKGTVLFERELPCEVSDIAECLAGFPHPIERVGFEAGAMSQHLFWLFRDLCG
jgi:transposase